MRNDRSLGQPHLTFGIEMEFLLATLPDETEDPHEHDERQVYGIATPRKVGWDAVHNRDPNRKAYRHIAHTLHKAGISVQSDERSDVSTLLLEQPNEGDWILKDDISLIQDTIEGYPYELVAVELISPPFYFSKDAITQIEAVCDILTNKYRIVYSGALHVHVGNETHGFSGGVLQRLLATLWTFDTALESIHPRHRIEERHSLCLRRQSNLARRLESPGMNNRKALEELLERTFPTDTAFWQHVLNLSDNSFERGAYNFRPLKGVDDKRTIEFRMHESTLDGSAIRNWIQVCVGLIEFALVPNPLLTPFLLASIDYDEFDVRKLLKAADMDPQVLFYGAKEQALKTAFENEIHVGMDTVDIATPSRPQITTVDIASCASFFVWTSNSERLIGCNSFRGEPVITSDHHLEDMVHLTAEKTQGHTVGAITIVCLETTGDTERVERVFSELFPNIRVVSHEYPLKEQIIRDREGDENKEGIGHWISRNEIKEVADFRMSAHISAPGKVEIRYLWIADDPEKDPQFTHDHSQRVWVPQHVTESW